jgi:hypothetical protein
MRSHGSYLTSVGQIRPTKDALISVSHKIEPTELSGISVHIKYVDGSAPNLIHPQPPAWHFLSVKIETAQCAHPHVTACPSATRTRHIGFPHFCPVCHLAALSATRPTHIGRLSSCSSWPCGASPVPSMLATQTAAWSSTRPPAPPPVRPKILPSIESGRHPAGTTTQPCRVWPPPAHRPPASTLVPLLAPLLCLEPTLSPAPTAPSSIKVQEICTYIFTTRWIVDCDGVYLA